MILAGDIGATKTVIASCELDGGTLSIRHSKSYPSRSFRSLGDVLQVFLRDHPVAVTAAAFGIAGPVVDGRSKLTNLGWDVDSREVAALLRLPAVGLINDIEATAYGTQRLAADEMLVLNSGVPTPRGAIAVIAAGTGLGEGGLLWDGRRYRSIPSEGGHAEFGPRNETEIELLKFLLRRYPRVSYERIVAGPGLLSLYDFFRSRSSEAEPAWLRERMAGGDPSAVISRAGLDGSDSVCREVLEMFVSLYGAEAGNLALKILATGGVYVGGGIVPKILPLMQQGSFLASFVNKGRYTELMKRMPVCLILNERTALLGAAHYALILHEME